VKEWIPFSTGNIGGDGERRRMGPNMMQQYPDSQQLFMGNLPLHATEDDLKVNLCSYLSKVTTFKHQDFLVHMKHINCSRN
jgi:hypothetical protein